MRTQKNLFTALAIVLVLLLGQACKKDHELEETELKKNPLVYTNFEAIKTIYPESDDSDVPIYYSPSIKFNYPINTPFTEEIDGELRKFRILVDINAKFIYQYDWEFSSSVVHETWHSNDSLSLFFDDGLLAAGGKLFLTIDVVLEGMVDDIWYRTVNEEFRLNKFSHEKNVNVQTVYQGDQVTFNEQYPADEYGSMPGDTIILKTNYLLNQVTQVNPHIQKTLSVYNVQFRELLTGDLIPASYDIDSCFVSVGLPSSMKPSSSYNIEVEVRWEYAVDDSEWIMADKGYVFKNKYTIRFFMNEDDKSILYSYPYISQYHYLKNEYDKGYIRFVELPEGIHVTDIGTEYELGVKITSFESGEYHTVPAQLQSDSLFLSYQMPIDFLENEYVYRISLHKIINNEFLPESYGYYFRTSMFNTFLEKMQQKEFRVCNAYATSTGIHQLNYYMYDLGETFDFWESMAIYSPFVSHPYLSGPIRTEIIPEESTWITEVEPLKNMYDYLSANPEIVSWRDPKLYGVPVLYNTVNAWTPSYNHPKLLTPEIMETGAQTISVPSTPNMNYNLVFSSTVTSILSQERFRLNAYLAQNDLPTIDGFFWYTNRTIKYKVKYVLPGTDLVTSDEYTYVFAGG